MVANLLLIKQETRTISEAVEIFHRNEDLQGAIDEILNCPALDGGCGHEPERTRRRRAQLRASSKLRLADLKDSQLPQVPVSRLPRDRIARSETDQRSADRR